MLASAASIAVSTIFAPATMAQTAATPSIEVSPQVFHVLSLWSTQSGNDLSLATYLKAQSPELLAKWAEKSIGDNSLDGELDSIYPGLLDTQDSDVDLPATEILIRRNNGKTDQSLSSFVKVKSPDIYSRWLKETTSFPQNGGVMDFANRFFPNFALDVSNALAKLGAGDGGRGGDGECECSFVYTRMKSSWSHEMFTDPENSSSNSGHIVFEGIRTMNGPAHSGNMYLYRSHGETTKEYKGESLTNYVKLGAKIFCHEKGTDRPCYGALCSGQMFGRGEWSAQTMVLAYEWGGWFRSTYANAAASDAAIFKYETPAGEIVKFQKGVAQKAELKQTFDISPVISFAQSVIGMIATTNFSASQLTSLNVKQLFGVVSHSGSEGTWLQDVNAMDALNQNQPINITNNYDYYATLTSSASTMVKAKGKTGGNAKAGAAYAGSYGSGVVFKVERCTMPSGALIPTPAPVALWSYAQENTVNVPFHNQGATAPVSENTLKNNLAQYLSFTYGSNSGLSQAVLSQPDGSYP